jgi:hypothetical protein
MSVFVHGHSKASKSYPFSSTPLFMSASPSKVQIPVAARSMAWAYDHSLAGIVGSNPAGAWMSVFSECCMLCRKRSLRRAGYSSRGVLPSAVCPEYNRGTSTMRRRWPIRGVAPWGKKSPSIKTIPRYRGMRLQNHTWSAWMTQSLFSSLPPNMFSQVLINMLYTFFFSQTSPTALFLTDPCSYLPHSHFEAVTDLILRATSRSLSGSAGPSLLHALRRQCADVTTSSHG